MSPNSHENVVDGVNMKAEEPRNRQRNNTKLKSGTRKPLPQKKFEIRDSLLTELFRNPHLVTIHHMFVASLVGLCVNHVAGDYLKNGQIHLGFRLIYLGFAKFHIVISMWLTMNLISFLGFYLFNVWAHLRVNLPPKSQQLRIWDIFGLMAVACYYGYAFIFIPIIVTKLHLPPASSVILLLEQVRLLMKYHAFIRENAPKVLGYKSHSDQVLDLPNFSHYLYFLFAPTLIYRDEYPRTKAIHWDFVGYRTLELFGVILYYSFLLENFLLPHYVEFGLRPFTWREILISMFENSIVGILFLLCGFYVVLHSVQNLFAELLRFGDRMFYKDWWTCNSYSDFFRTWNIVVHDWLYSYIYKDFYEIVVPGNKLVAKIVVFTISAIVHEWVMTYMFDLFLPAMFVQFFFAGTILSSLNPPKHPVLNIGFWYALALGSGTLSSMYTMEYYARWNAPITNQTLIDFFIPRMISCNNCISW